MIIGTNNRLQMSNGLNFKVSIHNPNSRLIRMLSYLMFNGAQTKRDMLDNLFNKQKHSLAWGSYMFTLARAHGLVETKRSGRFTFWNLTNKGYALLDEVTK